jgi:hypothetical protein
VEEMTVVVDLEVDFHNIDETGYIWSWLTDARDPSVIHQGAIVVLGDEDALAMGRVVDLVPEEKGTIVHVDVLPGTIDAYFDAVSRSAVTSP